MAPHVNNNTLKGTPETQWNQRQKLGNGQGEETRLIQIQLTNYWAMLSPKKLKTTFLAIPSFFLHSIEDAIKTFSIFYAANYLKLLFLIGRF